MKMTRRQFALSVAAATTLRSSLFASPLSPIGVPRGSATREKLVGTSETLHYDFPDSRHMMIRPAQPSKHWSVIWKRY